MTWVCSLADRDTRGTDVGVIAPALDAFLIELHSEPLPPEVVAWAHPLGSGARAQKSQTDFYARKASKARWGESPHNYRLALDSYPLILDAAGKRVVSGDPRHYLLIGVVARRIGLAWGGTWLKFADHPHVEVPGWKTVVKAALGPTFPRAI